MQLGPITEHEGNIFGISPSTVRPYEYPDNVHFALAYEFDLNEYRIDREAYNMLDWLGDIGGLKEAMMIIFGFIFGLFNYHTFEDYLVSKLYRATTARDRASSAVDAHDLYWMKHEGKDLKPERLNCCVQRLHDCGIPHKRLRKST